MSCDAKTINEILSIPDTVPLPEFQSLIKGHEEDKKGDEEEKDKKNKKKKKKEVENPEKKMEDFHIVVCEFLCQDNKAQWTSS